MQVHVFERFLNFKSHFSPSTLGYKNVNGFENQSVDLRECTRIRTKINIKIKEITRKSFCVFEFYIFSFVFNIYLQKWF